jgi:predicted RNA-binding protein associated with RNAse of E/G family
MDSNSLMENQAITISKRDIHGKETWRYQGCLLCRDQESLVVEAFFDRQDILFYGILLGKGDRFVETYYTDRWYNIFEIHAREDDRLRGWYCNISYPIEIDGDLISYVDLCLDLLIYPDGRQVVLDEDEFAALEITPETRSGALAALEELQAEFLRKFDHLQRTQSPEA